MSVYWPHRFIYKPDAVRPGQVWRDRLRPRDDIGQPLRFFVIELWDDEVANCYSALSDSGSDVWVSYFCKECDDLLGDPRYELMQDSEGNEAIDRSVARICDDYLERKRTPQKEAEWHSAKN